MNRKTVPRVGRDRFTFAMLLYGEVFVSGRWIAFSERSAREMYKLDRAYGEGPTNAD